MQKWRNVNFYGNRKLYYKFTDNDSIVSITIGPYLLISGQRGGKWRNSVIQ